MTEHQAWELYCKAVVDPREEDFKTWCENSGIIIKDDKPMNRYTIYCTEEQTKKALELGAPIEFQEDASHDDGKSPINPTAEQMMGWIESISIIQLKMEKQMGESGTQYRIWVRDECKPFSDIIEMRNYPTRKDATLAAIDAALDYLSKNK